MGVRGCCGGEEAGMEVPLGGAVGVLVGFYGCVEGVAKIRVL